MATSAAKKLEENIATYSKNHFRHNADQEGQEFVPSLLRMQIHEKEDNVDSPSMLRSIVTNK